MLSHIKGLIFFFSIILIVYVSFGFGVTVSNDAATNIEQISALNILSRSSHFTFNFLGVLFYFVFSNCLDFSAIFSVQIMLSLFSLAGAISLYFIVTQKFKNIKLALLSVIIYSFSTGIFRFSLQCEYLVLVPSLALISLALYAYNRALLAGFVFALGLLTSPFILLITPAFFLYNCKNSLFKLKNIIFITSLLILYIFVSIFTFNETVKGEWSYKLVADHYKEALPKMNYIKITANYVYGYFRSFHILIPFIFIGIIALFKTDRILLLIIVLIWIMHLPVAIPDARYGAYQFTFYPFIALAAALGVLQLLAERRAFFISIMLLFLCLSFYVVGTERKFNRDLKKTYTMMQNDKSIPDSSILILYQDLKPIYTLYAPKLKPLKIMTVYQEKMAGDLPGYKKTNLSMVISENVNIFLLESGTSMPDDKVKMLFSEFVKGQGVKVKGFGMEKLVPYTPGKKFELLGSYPIDLYRINNK